MREYAYYASLSPRTRALNVLRGLFRSRPLERWLQARVAGSTPDAWMARLIPPEYLYAKGSWRNVERHGVKLRLDLSNTTDHGAFYDLLDIGDEHLNRRIRPTDVVVDIGANIGVRSLAFSRAVPQGRVISFEPHPHTFARLKEHVDMNAPGNVTFVNKGVGQHVDTARLYQVVETNSGMNRILSDTGSAASLPFVEVHLSPLEPMLEAAGVPHVDVIKVDVEGFEMEVLLGARAVIERDHPTLFIELDDDNLKESGSSAPALVAWLRDRGYDVRDAITEGSLPTDLAHCHFDILCLPSR